MAKRAPGQAFWLLYLILTLLCSPSEETICQHCGKDFKVLGRHVWRCKARIITDQPTAPPNNRMVTTQETLNYAESADLSLVNLNNLHDENLLDAYITDYDKELQDEGSNNLCRDTEMECCCGKKCKGLKGLRAHRRFCHVDSIPGLNTLFALEDLPTQCSEMPCSQNNVETDLPDKKNIKPGIKLPKSPIEWSRANDHFKESLNTYSEITDIDYEIKSLQDEIYSYFESTYGSHNTVGDQIGFSEFQGKYNHLSRRQLKKHLHYLKSLFDDALSAEISFISKLLRLKYSKKNHRLLTEDTHDNQIERNFWKYCKDIFEDNETVLPEFDETTCSDFFRTHLRAKQPTRNFDIPPWMKRLTEPNDEFNTSAPTYSEIASIIKRMKSSSSACPFDQVSILALKRCPILRTALLRILKFCWETKSVPRIWKYSFTILIYKKDSPTNPANFRPITLQPVLGKIYSALIRNRIHTFMIKNNYIETKIQKGFCNGVSGTIEHTELLTHMINHARTNQRSMITTLLDLKNAFGEVDHRLLESVLIYHHIPESIIELVLNLYSNYSVSIGTKAFITDPIRVGKGVLQGDCLSPLLFNMCINTLIKCIEDDRIRTMGYCYWDSLRPRHWFQFADDTAIVTATEEDNQLLLNIFTKWCHWSGFNIKVDKCSTFGIKKYGSKATQYRPYLRVNNQIIPPVEMGESFKYLGKHFNYKMSSKPVEQELEAEIVDYLEKIHNLPLHPKHKISIITKYVYSKIRWRLSVYHLSLTWITQNLDDKILSYVKRWLHFHQGANLSHLKLSVSKFGFGLQLAADVFQYCKLSIRKILSKSINVEIRALFKITNYNNITTDSIIINNERNPKSALQHQIENNVLDHLSTLKEQNSIMRHIKQVSTGKQISSWKAISDQMPKNIYVFVRRALIYSLPNNSNLHRWGKIEAASCDLCSERQTQRHMLSNCSVAVQEGRYTWRHDSILYTMLRYLSQLSSYGFKIYGDLQDYRCPSELFQSFRPDVVITKNDTIYVIELTCCFETNTEKSRNYKMEKYNRIERDCLLTFKHFKKIFVEITTLGHITKHIKQLKRLFNGTEINCRRMLEKCVEVSMRASFYLYIRRNKSWTNPDLLKFY